MGCRPKRPINPEQIAAIGAFAAKFPFPIKPPRRSCKELAQRIGVTAQQAQNKFKQAQRDQFRDRQHCQAAFRIISDGHTYEIFADGQVTGFDTSKPLTVVNRIPVLIAAELQAASVS